MNGEELVKKVRLLVNESDDSSDVSLLSPDTRSLDDSIKELLPQAVAFVQRNKSSACRRVNTVSTSTVQLVEKDDSGGGRMLLPNDFVSLVHFKLPAWERPITALQPAASRLAMRQFNAHTRAGVSKPVAVEALDEGGRKVALLFPAPLITLIAPDSFVYEALFDFSKGLQCYDNEMLDAVLYECTALLYTLFERYDAANTFHSLALAACGRGAAT